MARLVSYVLRAIDQECTAHFALRSLDERRRYLRIELIPRSDGATLVMSSPTSGYGRPQILDRTRRIAELLEIPAVMDAVDRIVTHANRLIGERGVDATHLLPGGRWGGGYVTINFFTDE